MRWKRSLAVILVPLVFSSLGADCLMFRPDTVDLSPGDTNGSSQCLNQFVSEINRLCNTFSCSISVQPNWCQEESSIPPGGYHRYVSHERSRIYKNNALFLGRCEECEGTSECLRIWIDDSGRWLTQGDSDLFPDETTGIWVRASSRIGKEITLGQTTWIPKALGSDGLSLWIVSDLIDRPLLLLPELTGYEIVHFYYAGSQLRVDSLIYLEGTDDNGDRGA